MAPSSFTTRLRDVLSDPRSAWLKHRWNRRLARYTRAEADIAEEFDEDFYLAAYPGVARLSVRPIEHYLLAGWRQGKDPSPNFSTSAYVETYPDVISMRINPFRHYVTHGRNEGRIAVESEERPRKRPRSRGAGSRPQKSLRREILDLALDPYAASLHARWLLKGKTHQRIRRRIRPAFDEDFYITTYPEVTKINIGPLRHYILVGWREGKDPSALFSTRGYIEMYGDVGARRINPLYHFMMDGQREGRLAPLSIARRNVLAKPTDPLELPPIPTAEAWAAMPRRVVDPPSAKAVNVVIPVYRSLPHVAATIASVLKADCATVFECLVVDDCSPEPEVSALLAQLAESGHIRLVVNTENLGFVRSVNRGMAVNTERDVVLLNADTYVGPGWLDRLVAPFADDPTIATITPLSNNATIASYPNTAVDNDYELEVPPETIDRLAAEANGNTVVDVPTGIGFCMAIRRKALDQVGDFDAETFGLGYGEECDFCMRSMRVGWRNVIATGAYVRHYGSTSFGPTQSKRSAEAQVKIAEKHPDYKTRINRYLAADPVLPSRILLDVARMKEAFGPVSVLFFSHTRGGGIETYLDYLRERLKVDGLEDVARRALVARTMPGGFVEFSSFSVDPLPYMPNLQVLNVERHKGLLGRVIALLAPELVHVNTFAGLTQPAIGAVMSALREAGRPYWHVWHDHQPLCPRLTFIDAEERYCGETDASRCTSCLAASATSFEWVAIDDWRQQFRAYLAGADVISAPSEAAALRARRLAGVSKVAVHPHPEPQLAGIKPLERRTVDLDERRIVTLGALGPHKGSNLLYAMAKDAAVRDLDMSLHVVGYTSVQELANEPKATVYGRYHGDADAARKVARVEPDLFFCSSVWPETYVFTLSVAMALGLPIVTYDMGAQAERVRQYGRGLLLDPRLANDPVGTNDALLAIDVEALWEKPAVVEFATESSLSRYFLDRRERAGLAREMGVAEIVDPRASGTRAGSAAQMAQPL